MAEYKEHGLLPFINALAECGPFNEGEASVLAADLLEKGFKHLSYSQIEARYLNSGSSQFIDMPTDAVYSTIYQKVADWYGGKIIVFKDKDHRSIDRTYFDLKKAEKPLSSQAPSDNGEFLTPGYIAGKDIEGIWIKSEDQRIFTEDRAHRNLEHSSPLAWAFQKVVLDGHTYVLVLDGNGNNCLLQDRDNRFYACELNYPDPGTPGIKPFPKIKLDQQLAVAAIITVCKNSETCQIPAKLWNAYNHNTAASFPEYILNEFKKTTVNGNPIAIFRQETKPILKTTPIRIISAKGTPPPPGVTKGNSTEPVSKFCNGKSHCGYKVSLQYLPDPAPGLLKSFDVQWHCSDSKDIPHLLKANGNEIPKVLDLTCPKGESIEIQEATFGGNLIANANKDQTNTVKHLCDGLVECNIPNLNNYEIAYSCGDSEKILKITIHDAHRLSCL